MSVYRIGRVSRHAAALTIGAGLLLSAAAPALGQDAVGFSGGGKAGQDDPYASYAYTVAPSTVDYNNEVYLYGTADDGKGYYTSWNGTEWSTYGSWDTQPADFKWEPSTTEYKGAQLVTYAGQDDKYYTNTWDGQAWTGWNDISGPYTFKQAPTTVKYNDMLYVYGAAADGNVYGKSYDGATWSDWSAVNETYTAGAYQPYAVEWNGYNNVFWTGEDGKAYWNRYDGSAWTGAVELAGDYTYADSLYAVAYDNTLYAYATGADGMPYYNTFAEGQGWGGWQAYATAPAAQVAYQPSVSVYEDKQHVIYTGKDGHAYYTSYDGASWSGWEDLGTNYAYDTVQYGYGDGHYLAYTGADGDIYYKTYSGGGDLPAGQDPTPTPGY